MEVNPSSTAPADGRCSVRADATVFSEEVVLRAAHKLTDCAFVGVVREGGQYILQMHLRGNDSGVSALEGRFANLLLDEELRERVAKETEAERRLIMAYALSKQPLIKDGAPEGDYCTNGS
jgi:His-Xaa-Ser system protein HxsD